MTKRKSSHPSIYVYVGIYGMFGTHYSLVTHYITAEHMCAAGIGERDLAPLGCHYISAGSQSFTYNYELHPRRTPRSGFLGVFRAASTPLIVETIIEAARRIQQEAEQT